MTASREFAATSIGWAQHAFLADARHGCRLDMRRERDG